MTQQAEKNRSGWRWGALILGVLLLGTTEPEAATVTITDCTSDSHIVKVGGKTTIDVGGDDLVLSCSLTVPGRAELVGANVVISGNITAVDSIAINASGTLSVEVAELLATDGAGFATLTSVRDMTFRGAVVRVGNDQGTGANLKLLCTGTDPLCNITARQSSFTGKRVEMTAAGGFYFGLVQVISRSPLDWIRVTALGGNADMSGCGNLFLSGPEGSLDLYAAGSIDLAFAQVVVARDINILAGLGAPTDVPSTIRLTGATITNEYGKPGDVIIATANNGGGINISGAVIVDDDRDVASLNGREVVPHVGFNNVVGTPDRDE